MLIFVKNLKCRIKNLKFAIQNLKCRIKNLKCRLTILKSILNETILKAVRPIFFKSSYTLSKKFFIFLYFLKRIL
jgi:hypothetical protein